ncbi:LTA synthase family protein [Clostridium sp. MSJ-11]|uniref:LTA synthase family protein n=1 Tax=Clostridium mobile TaxID=2841512 RepID=A0ABS6ELM4_9CLOT|nr:LTA synthase family protein [Clostridium mobile]MBU5485692.1 LTA synthase family protein [Clostridium mobile]
MKLVVNNSYKPFTVRDYINKAILIFNENRIFFLTILSLLIKSIFFLGFIASSSGNYIALFKLPIYLVNFILYVSLITIFLSVGYLFKGLGQAFAFVTINLLLSLFMVADLIYYRGFQSFISLYSLSQGGNLDNLGETIISMLRSQDILFIIDIIIFLVIILRKKTSYRQAKRKVSLFFILLIASSSLSFYYHYRYDILEDGKNKRYFHIYWSPLYSMGSMSPIGYHIYDSYLYFKNSKQLELTEKDHKEINAWYDNKEKNIEDNSYKGALKGKNLIFMQIESLESFLIGAKVNGEEITPNLNKLLKNSLHFSEIYEQVSGGNSSDGDLMANTSMHPVKNGSTFFRFPSNKYNSLPRLMKKLGYYTSAFHPDGGGYWNWMPALQSMEFDKCTDVTGFNLDETIGLGLSDGSYLKQLSEKIISQPRPFYSFLVTLTSHMPFDLPKEYRHMKLPEEMDNNILGDYFQSIHYTDKHLGKFIDSLEQNDLLKDTVLVIYGDHTGVHKYYKDKLEAINPKENWWYKDNFTVPLIIYSKDLEGKSFKTIGGQIDIMPTVAYLMGVPEEEYINTAMGRNLLKTRKNFTILSNGVYIGDYKTEEEKRHAIEALNISDKLIRSGYFK